MELALPLLASKGKGPLPVCDLQGSFAKQIIQGPT